MGQPSAFGWASDSRRAPPGTVLLGAPAPTQPDAPSKSAPRPTAQRNITTYRTVMIFEQYGDELRIAGVSIDV